jgi:hypothetical protein
LSGRIVGEEQKGLHEVAIADLGGLNASVKTAIDLIHGI